MALDIGRDELAARTNLRAFRLRELQRSLRQRITYSPAAEGFIDPRVLKVDQAGTWSGVSQLRLVPIKIDAKSLVGEVVLYFHCGS